MIIRAALESDVERLAQIWFDGWRDGHLAVVPAALARLRTFESFRERLHAALPDVRVAVEADSAIGFAIVKGDELYQFYVAAEARGTGVASQLIADAEQHLAGRGVTTAWLACAIGNDRAARFYEKSGWHRTATVTYQAETAAGPFAIQNWRYEKVLHR